MDDIKAAIEDTLHTIDPSRSHLERSLRQGPVELRLYHGKMLKVLVWISALSVALAMVGLMFGIRWLTPFALLFFVVFIPGTAIGLIVVPFLRKKRLDVSRAGIQIDHGNGRVDWYAFAEIQSIHLPRAPYVATPFRICMRDGRELGLIPSWERFDYVLDLLSIGRPDLTGMPEFMKYRSACIVFDHVVSRSAQRGPLITFVDGVVRSFVAGVFGVGMIFAWKSLSGAGVQWSTSGYRAFSDIFFICGFIWAGWLIAQDVILARQLLKRLQKDPNDVRRDRSIEDWLMQPFSGPSGIVFGVAVFMSAMITIGRTNVTYHATPNASSRPRQEVVLTPVAPPAQRAEPRQPATPPKKAPFKPYSTRPKPSSKNTQQH
ncbi:MAG: hypothetical protein V4760_05900 [Bdellovibrionota bacterium]